MLGCLAGHWLERVANPRKIRIVLHVAGVVLVSRLQRENLARAMLTGRKLLRRSPRATTTQADR